jgi:hypothetical protein
MFAYQNLAYKLYCQDFFYSECVPSPLTARLLPAVLKKSSPNPIITTNKDLSKDLNPQHLHCSRQIPFPVSVFFTGCQDCRMGVRNGTLLFTAGLASSLGSFHRYVMTLRFRSFCRVRFNQSCSFSYAIPSVVYGVDSVAFQCQKQLRPRVRHRSP